MISKKDVARFAKEWKDIVKSAIDSGDYMIWPIEPDKDNNDCNINILMSHGCQCGGE